MLLERERELTVIDAALEAASSRGSGSTVLIEGGAGMGKTALLEAGAVSARERGFAVLRARGGELEREIPFGVARQLLEAKLLDADEEERHDLLAGAAAPAAQALGRIAGVGDVEAAGIVHGLHWLTLNLAERGPLLLAIDDLQWADLASQRFVAYLCRRIGGSAVVALLGCRSDATGEGPLALLAGDPVVSEVTLAPLSERAVAQLVRDRHPAARAEFCRACHEAGGGNPFMISALLSALERDGFDAAAADADRVRAITPEEITRSVTARLAQLPAAASELCAGVAVLGRSGELRTAAAIAGLDLAAAAEAAEALTGAGLLADGRPLEFVHPVVREVVYADLGAGRRMSLHRSAAERLAADGADPEVVAMHLLDCERSGDPWVVSQLEAAAASALGRGAAEIAVDLLARAVAEPAEPEARPGLLRSLGIAATRAGRPEAVEHLAAAQSGAELAAEAAVGIELSWAQLIFGRVDAAIATLEGLLGSPAAAAAEPLAVEAELATARATQVAAGERRERAGLEALVPELEGGELPRLVARACLAFARTKDCAPAPEVAELALTTLGEGGLLDSKGPDSIAQFYATMTLLSADRFDDAAREIEVALARARERSAIWALGSQHFLRAELALRRGDLAEAELDARTSLELAEAHGYLVGVPASLAVYVTALTELGRLDQAWAALADRDLEGELPPVATFSFVQEARGRLRAARGEHADALADLLEAGERYALWGVWNPSVAEWRTLAAQCAATLGEREQALGLAREARKLARAFGASRALGIAERTLALLEPDRERSIPGLRRATATLEDSGAALELARARVELGSALRRDGARREAREPLRQGLDTAARAGAEPLLERARVELEACGARPRSLVLSGAESLTPSERRVAELAAGGASNREIAETLFVTRKTVEYHLTGVYRKLDIDSRERLAEALRAEAPPS